MCIKYNIIILVASISLALCSLVPYLRKCKLDDPKCMKESSQNILPKFASGIPEANVNILDPLQIKYVDAHTSNLKLTVTDLIVTGLKNCEIKKMQFDKSKSKLSVKIMCTCRLNGKYDMKGNLFVLPIEGKGNIHVDLRKILINLEAELTEKVGKDEKNHWNLKSWRHTFDLKDKSDVKFDNLFPHNQILRKTTEQLIASSGNDVITEIGPPIIRAVVSKVVDNADKFFQTVPLEDLIQN